MADVRFDGRVAIVTGAGGGLGRSHALLLASRGAKVVVNDLGGAFDGSGSGSTTMAQKVCDEIKAAGGEAVPDYNSVSTPDGAAGIVKTALDTFGKLDIVINNAGILRDKSIVKMEEEDWRKVIQVHLDGSYFVTKAAWEHLRANNFGRVIFTTSAAGLYGNFGQTNYSAAKMGIVGLVNTLKLEGAKYNIYSNAIAPIAGTRLTATVMPQPMLDMLKPEAVSPMVAYLCSEESTVNGKIISAGAGHFAVAQMVEAKGATIKGDVSIEGVREKLDQIMDLEGAVTLGNAGEAGSKVFAALSA
ncbi:MAG: SDR family oxidoreductase [Deltaproteobacteria bacterium]|jgi:NAD(P)-dependent dehydrogenase (short-subunit alcohol dehydrogenase family)|nr:SDR family oxidoreductase [Deltaproteobacteria bacterium]MCC7116769.1 SDR family oxidoreductase [Burkholderiales bacterium]